MSRTSWIGVVLAAISLACGDDDAAPTMPAADGGGKCIERSQLYARDEALPLGASVSDARPACVPSCSDEPPNIDSYPNLASLPKGACTKNDSTCDMAAYRACPCPGSRGVVSAYRCRCDGGEWSCENVAAGAAGCTPICDDAGD